MPQPRKKNPVIPEAIDALIRQMLSLDPAERPPTMVEVQERLSGAIEAFSEAAELGPSDIVRSRTEGLGPANRRKYRRLRAGMDVELTPCETDEKKAIMLISKIENFSENGALIATASPLPVGTIVTLEFNLEAKAARVHVLGLVRWVSTPPEEPGMGIQFIEVSTSNRKQFREFVDVRMAEEMGRALTRTPLHRALLKLIAENWGRAIPTEVFVQATGVSKQLLRGTLPEFEKYGLIKLMHGSVKCVRPSAVQLSEAIRKALCKR